MQKVVGKHFIIDVLQKDCLQKTRFKGVLETFVVCKIKVLESELTVHRKAVRIDVNSTASPQKKEKDGSLGLECVDK